MRLSLVADSSCDAVFSVFEFELGRSLVVLAVIAGFPIALISAWAFELTPEGVKRTEDVDVTGKTVARRHVIYIAVVSAVLSIGLLSSVATPHHAPVLPKPDGRGCAIGTSQIDCGSAIREPERRQGQRLLC